MALGISIQKENAVNASSVCREISQLCEKIVEEEHYFIYTPLSGKVIDVLRLLRQNGIDYDLRDIPENTGDIPF